MLANKTALEQAGRVWWVAPSFPQSSMAWRELKALAAQIPEKVVREDMRLIRLPGGGEIMVKSADAPDSLRGEGLDLVVLDEAAFIPEPVWTDALRPTLSDRKGAALFISTPQGKNWFYHAWLRGIDAERSDWQSWQYPTSDNPLIDPSEIEAARETLPERVFRQEYLADFIDDAGAVFRYVRAAATALLQREAVAGHSYTFGCDWAKANDFTVIAVYDRTLQAIVALDRFNQIDYTVQISRLEALAARFRPVKIVAETNSMGDVLIEQLRRKQLPVVPFTTTAHTKQEVIEGLAVALEQGEITIIPDPVLISELEAYSLERTSSGNIRYSAPPGLHDDTVMAVAMARWQAGRASNSAVGAFG